MEDPLISRGEKGSMHAVALSPAAQLAQNADESGWHAVALARLNSLTKPHGSMGRLEELAARMVCIRKQNRPSCTNKTVYVFAADHGVAAR